MAPGRPVDAVRHAASAMAQDGTLMLIEPFARDRVEDNINPIGSPLLLRWVDHYVLRPRSFWRMAPTSSARRQGRASSRTLLRVTRLGTMRRAMRTPFNLIIEARR